MERMLQNCQEMARIISEYKVIEQELYSDPVFLDLWEHHVISLFLAHIRRSKEEDPPCLGERHYEFIIQNPPYRALLLSPDPEFDPVARDVQLIFRDASQLFLRGYATRSGLAGLRASSFGIAHEIVNPSWDTECENDIEQALGDYVRDVPSLIKFAIQIGNGDISIPGSGHNQAPIAA